MMHLNKQNNSNDTTILGRSFISIKTNIKKKPD